MFWLTCKIRSAVFYKYDNIQLRLFIEISKTGDFKKILAKGEANIDRCMEAWEAIVRANELAGGRTEFITYLDLSQSYLQMINEHQLVRACLLKLSIVEDQECIQELSDRGYKVVTGNPADYFKSLERSMSMSNNSITQILMKRKELDLLSEENKGKSVEFEDLLAEASLGLKFQLPDNITLALYNAYRKTLTKKHRGRNQEVGSD